MPRLAATARSESSVPQRDHQKSDLCPGRASTHPIIPQINPGTLKSTPNGARNTNPKPMKPRQTAAAPKPKEVRFTVVGPPGTVAMTLLLPITISTGHGTLLLFRLPVVVTILSSYLFAKVVPAAPQKCFTRPTGGAMRRGSHSSQKVVETLSKLTGILHCLQPAESAVNRGSDHRACDGGASDGSVGVCRQPRCGDAAWPRYSRARLGTFGGDGSAVARSWDRSVCWRCVPATLLGRSGARR